ncbi:unnamed protein product [Protopolystoma xenopodis]|uniref:Uncharacterized protein n=1 Tax=Protopolystoma xenopodis TaxID=117903 RepID=A0A448WUS2_9PLAT|nr:unnamed protein product [Protopolystoma xenopodis]
MWPRVCVNIRHLAISLYRLGLTGPSRVSSSPIYSPKPSFFWTVYLIVMTMIIVRRIAVKSVSFRNSEASTERPRILTQLLPLATSFRLSCLCSVGLSTTSSMPHRPYPTIPGVLAHPQIALSPPGPSRSANYCYI